jgi:hypothetical protein
MTDEPCFPEEPAIEPRPVPAQRRLEFLAAAELGRQGPCIAHLKQEHGQAVGTARYRGPGEMRVRGDSKQCHPCRVADEQIEADRQFLLAAGAYLKEIEDAGDYPNWEGPSIEGVRTIRWQG